MEDKKEVPKRPEPNVETGSVPSLKEAIKEVIKDVKESLGKGKK